MGFILARSIMKDGRAPFEYLCGGAGERLRWAFLPERALGWPSQQAAELMLNEIGRPKGVIVQPYPLTEV